MTRDALMTKFPSFRHLLATVLACLVLLLATPVSLAHGVAEDGALLVHTAQGMQAITSAEISVRPAAARAL